MYFALHAGSPLVFAHVFNINIDEGYSVYFSHIFSLRSNQLNSHFFLLLGPDWVRMLWSDQRLGVRQEHTLDQMPDHRAHSFTPRGDLDSAIHLFAWFGRWEETGEPQGKHSQTQGNGTTQYCN